MNIFTKTVAGRPITWVKVLALVLGSQWFFPVSCSSTLYTATNVIARLDARDVVHGDVVHSGFSVVVAPGENGQPFRRASLPDLESLRQKGEAYSLLMSKPSDQVDVNHRTRIAYHVLESSEAHQVIEVQEIDDDKTIWSRYRATSSEVKPLTSRMFYMGYMFRSLPWALGIALLLYGIGWYLRRRLSAEAKGHC